VLALYTPDAVFVNPDGTESTGKVDHISGTYRFTLHRDTGGSWRYSRRQWI
jgi:hypothetical protein